MEKLTRAIVIKMFNSLTIELNKCNKDNKAKYSAMTRLKGHLRDVMDNQGRIKNGREMIGKLQQRYQKCYYAK